MNLFKASDTSKVVLFYMVDATDGYIEETGLTPTVTVSKNGGAFGAVSGTVAEVANGVYKLTPAAGDVDTLGPVAFRASATGARPCLIAGRVVAYDPYDVIRQGMTALPNAAADAAGGLPISDAGALALDVKLAATDEITAARMGALTDWIDGGRLDSIIDAIVADTGTDGVVVAAGSKTGYALTTAPPTAAQIVTEFGTGSTLTACATATGFSTHTAANVVTALSTGATLTALATQTSVDAISTTIGIAGAGLTAIVATVSGTIDANVVEWKNETPSDLSTGKVVAEASFVLDAATISEIASEVAASVTSAAGSGGVQVDWNYDNGDVAQYDLRYLTGAGAGVYGATVKAYLKTEWDLGMRSASDVKGQTLTDAAGKFEAPLMLDGTHEYVLLYYKTGAYGPNIVEINVIDPA